VSSRQSQSVCPARLRADASGAADQKVYRFLAAAKLAAMIVLALDAQTAHNLDLKRRNCRPMSAIVLDAGGRVKAFQKQDGASMLAPSTLII